MDVKRCSSLREGIFYGAVSQEAASYYCKELNTTIEAEEKNIFFYRLFMFFRWFMKKIMLSILLIASFVFVGLPMNTRQANAATNLESYPTYSLYTKDTIIEKEIVNYDISSVQDYKIIEEIQYKITAEQGSVHDFYLPISAHVYDIPNIEIKVNGTAIESELLYGSNLYHYLGQNDIEKAINDSFGRTLDDTISGTLYKFNVVEDSLTITYKKSDNQPMIYQTSNSTQSSFNDGKITYTTNAKAGDVYVVYVINGDLEFVESNATFTKETITCKQFVDNYYSDWAEYYVEVNIEKEFLYSQMNRLLSTKNSETLDDFFLSTNNYRLNFLKFSVAMDTTSSTINYVNKARVQRDTTYEPFIHLFEREKTAQYPTEYTIKMTDEFPFIIESNIALNKEGNIYKATSNEDSFYAIFCSEESSKSKFADEENKKDKLVWYIVIAGVSALAVGVITYFLVGYIERKKGCK